MDFEKAKYEYPVEGIARTGKPGEPAAIFLLDGAWHLAAVGSANEAMLRFEGALHIATLTFPITAFHPQLN